MNLYVTGHFVNSSIDLWLFPDIPALKGFDLWPLCVNAGPGLEHRKCELTLTKCPGDFLKLGNSTSQSQHMRAEYILLVTSQTKHTNACMAKASLYTGVRKQKTSWPCRVTQLYLVTVALLSFTVIRTEQLATTACREETFVFTVPPEQQVRSIRGWWWGLTRSPRLRSGHSSKPLGLMVWHAVSFKSICRSMSQPLSTWTQSSSWIILTHTSVGHLLTGWSDVQNGKLKDLQRWEGPAAS